jgi:hypothetical protein
MTAIAKLLVFLTLVAGVGAAVFATAVYTQRPGWFDDVPDGAAPRGHVVMNFKGLARETDAQGKVAAGMSALAGKNLRELRAAEADRAARAAFYARLLAAARTGQVGFYQIKEGTDGRLELFDPAGRERPLADFTPVKGPDGKTLAGADTLNDLIAKATDRIVNDLTPKIEKHRADQKRLGGEIDVVSAKLVRQRVIREDLQNEASYLAVAEVNVAEQRGTAGRRKAQLEGRLRAFQGPKEPDR